MKTLQTVEVETLRSGTRKRCVTGWFSLSGALSMLAALLLSAGTMFGATSGYELWGVGRNEDGQLGDGTTENRLRATLVSKDVKSIDMGERCSFFILSDGTLMGMGANSDGQLGDGSHTRREVPIVIDSHVRSVSASNQNTLYVKEDGRLMGMGLNTNGQLGDGTTTDRSTPIQIDLDVVAAASGLNFTLYIKSDGKLLGMGANFYGQLGQGNQQEFHTPMLIDEGVSSVAASPMGDHSLYIKLDGTLMGMGSNHAGQLGDGTTADKYRPVMIATDLTDVVAGPDFTLYIRSDGTLEGMGQNAFGELGVGNQNEVHQPVVIDTDVTGMAAGGGYSLYIKSDGSLRAMGDNEYGQFGNSTTRSSSIPTLVQYADRVHAVSSGAGHSLFLKEESIPVIFNEPQSLTVAPGGEAKFTVVTNWIEDQSFQWLHADHALPNSGSTLSLVGVESSDAGDYGVMISSGDESISSRTVTFGVKAPPYDTEKMMNISTRGQILEGSKVLIAGFVLDGSGQKDVLIRGIGPALGQWGLSGLCTDPKLELFRNTNPATPSIAANESWSSATGDIPGISQRVGAFALSDGSKDAVLSMNLEPGAYTAKVSGLDGTGVGLVELYDADLDPLASTCNLSNISTRGEVGIGAQILIAGFVIAGDVPKQVLVRGVGPRLADFEVDGTLVDPYLQIVKNVPPYQFWVASNDNWSDSVNAAEIRRTSGSVGAFFLRKNSKDAVMLTWLEPGTYTAQVSGVDDGTGVALVEVYEVK